MSMPAKFAKEWTYQTIAVTVTYPAGWEGTLPADRYEAAKAADVLETVDDDNGDGGPARRKGRAGKAEG